MAADTYTIVRDGLFYHLKNDRTGLYDVEYLDCRAEAENYKAEYTAAALEADAAEQAELAAAMAAERAEYLAQEREKDLIYITIKRMYDQSKPATHPKNFAVTEILAAIDNHGRPSIEHKEAA